MYLNFHKYKKGIENSRLYKILGKNVIETISVQNIINIGS